MPKRDPTTRFSDRVADYSRYRPHYPPSILTLLKDRIALSPAWLIADVGAGTGLSAELFLQNGNRVVGVEPNLEMREAAEAALAQYSRFESRSGRAEQTGVPDASVDLIVAAQAFHWFDASAARREFSRILKGPRYVVLLWNRRRTEGTPFLQEYEALLRRFGVDYLEVRHDHISEQQLAGFFRSPPARESLFNAQRLDREALIGRARSSSYLPGSDHPEHESMLDAVNALFDRHEEAGTVDLAYDVDLYVGQL